MPHKKAKRSVRQQVRNEIGSNLPPKNNSLHSEPIPKSVARILNAQVIRDDFRKKRKSLEDGEIGSHPSKRRRTEKDSTKAKSTLKIQQGESIQHFNRRVEDDLRPLLKSAMQTARLVERSTIKEAGNSSRKKNDTLPKDNHTEQRGVEEDQIDQPRGSSKHTNSPKEFASISSSAPKRLNDVAQAPPEFKKLPRGASSLSSSKKDGVLSMAQKVLMEQEREKAIAQYRDLKASRKQHGSLES